jgi:aspartyl-tRNA(Asn)/glutamyl-tRNA(Gln) amidotransferase subunit A
LLNTFITQTVEGARTTALAKPMGRLAGVPIGLKDLVDVAGVCTTCGSWLHSAQVATDDATVWRRLRAAGCVLMGKLNTHEYAAGVTSENDRYGPVRNPWNTELVSGGSSGGSAAAVASALVSIAMGTDTGGSIRIPASFCGVVGYKPTFGLVDTGGVQPLAPSLDHVGPLARTVGDAAACLDVIAGTECEGFAASGSAHGLAGLRIVVPWEWLEASTAKVRSRFEASLSLLERAGAEVTDSPVLPDLGLLTALNRAIAYTEGSSTHEDKLRAGAAFGPLVEPRMQAGRFITASQYLAAQRLRRKVCEELAHVWSFGHLMATPTVPCPPPPLASRSVSLPLGEEPIGDALVKYTAPHSLTGGPAITLPSGWDDNGLPTGLQLAGPPHADGLVFFAAGAYEVARNQAVVTRTPAL